MGYKSIKVDIANTQCNEYYSKILKEKDGYYQKELMAIQAGIETDIQKMTIELAVIDSLEKCYEPVLFNYPEALRQREYERIDSLIKIRLDFSAKLLSEVKSREERIRLVRHTRFQKSHAFKNSVEKYIEKEIHTHFFVTTKDEKKIEEMAELAYSSN